MTYRVRMECECTMRIWHWKSHWNVQPHWNTSETTLKSFTKDNHSEILSLMTLKYVTYCYSTELSSYNPTETYWKIFSVTHILCSLYFSVTLVFQCDFQCHIQNMHPCLVWSKYHIMFGLWDNCTNLLSSVDSTNSYKFVEAVIWISLVFGTRHWH